MVVQMNFRFRIYPSQKQKVKLINNFKTCKSTYNHLLATSKDAYKFGNVSLTKFDYDAIIKGYSSDIHSQVLQNVSDRVSKAFANFFRRVKDKSCKEKGFPRYKSRVMSITYPQSGFKFISNKHIQVSKIGNLPIILHRIPKGKIKTLTIKQTKTSKWFAVFACEVPNVAVQHPSTSKVGIDVGLENFAVMSNGEFIGNPRPLAKSEARLKVLHRKVSRKAKGSRNRIKARFRLAKIYERVNNQRSDFLHKLSRRIAKSYSFIAVEKLQICNMVQNHHLAKSISDASWSSFINMMSYKAVICGGQLVEVDARRTSMTCSKCGNIQEMPLTMREFVCANCGFVCHRDLNSSYNILVRADCPELNAFGHDVRPLAREAVVDELGTTYGKVLSNQAVGSSIL